MTAGIRGYVPWGVALGLLFIGRTTLDWFVPTTDFAVRAAATTYAIAGLLFVVGAIATRRSGSLAAGARDAAYTCLVAAVCSAAASVLMLALWDGHATRTAIERSGGLVEVLVLPFALVIPGALIGMFGGLTASIANRFTQSEIGIL